MHGELKNNKLDPIARRKFLFSLSQPTNPVAGSLLAHIEQQLPQKTILAWESYGWISRDGLNYVLTKSGSVLLQEKSPPPPDDYNPVEYII